MNDVVSSQPAPQTTADYETAIEQLFAEMERLNELMRNDQAEIERLKAETKIIKARTQARLDALAKAI